MTATKNHIKRRILITGAARGIGRAIAVLYAEQGHEVLTPTREEIDFSSLSAVEDFAAHHLDNIDVLINNAAENKTGLLDHISTPDWERMLTVNLTTPMLLIRHAARGMCERGWGRVVNISSCFSLVSRSGRGAYSSTKAGLNGLTRTAAIEYASNNVLVNAVCPGFVETDLTHQNNNAEQIAALCRQVPLGRLAQPSEIARYVYFLGSDDNSYITGQTMVIDGGYLCQ